jgi:hypothetical protein
LDAAMSRAIQSAMTTASRSRLENFHTSAGVASASASAFEIAGTVPASRLVAMTCCRSTRAVVERKFHVRG